MLGWILKLTLMTMDHISVCICAYKRPQLLERLLISLNKLERSDEFTFSVVVVDNDPQKTGIKAVQEIRESVAIPVEVDHEPVRSISAARNRCVQLAKGNLIAFIDDDEFADPAWLLRLYKMLKASKAQGVLGPVHPDYPPGTPAWIIRGKIWERKSFLNGTVIQNSSDTRTGNVLLEAGIMVGPEPFDPCFGRSGGGDSDFFRRMMRKGHRFVWCENAMVFETVLPARANRKYLLQRALVRGSVSAQQNRFLSFGTAKSVVATLTYTAALPLLLVAGHHHFMKVLVKDCDHVGKLLAYAGWKVVRERPYN